MVQLNMPEIKDNNYVLWNNLLNNIQLMVNLYLCIQDGLIHKLSDKLCLIFIKNSKENLKIKIKVQIQ
jgi:hypothetical protein